MEGVRDPRKNNQITGTHNAAEFLGSRAGSKQSRPKRRTTQSNSAKDGDITFQIAWTVDRVSSLQNTRAIELAPLEQTALSISMSGHGLDISKQL
jgi:hypothetical protein